MAIGIRAVAAQGSQFDRWKTRGRVWAERHLHWCILEKGARYPITLVAEPPANQFAAGGILGILWVCQAVVW